MTNGASWGLCLAVAVGSNLDNLGAGLAYGIGRRRVGLPQNLLVAALTAACTAGAMGLGAAGDRLVPAAMAARAGGLVIVAVGLVSAGRALRGARAGGLGASRALRGARLGGLGASRLPGRPAQAAAAGSVPVSLGEALVVGIGLSLNNLAAGVGAGAAGLSLPLTTALSGVLSVVCLGAGGRLGRLERLAGPRGLGRAGPLAAAALLVAVGVRMCAV